MSLHYRPHRLLLETGPSPSPGNLTRSPSIYASEAKFDTNMVIILAALLCALIFALGLNSIVRCAIRCSRRLTLEANGETRACAAATGLKKSALRKIPVAVYGSGTSIPATDCPICLGEFVEGERVRVLPKCHHGFHMKCIDVWLSIHSSCPTCRHSLIGQSDDGGAADAGPGLGQPGNVSAGNGDHVVVHVEEVG